MQNSPAPHMLRSSPRCLNKVVSPEPRTTLGLGYVRRVAVLKLIKKYLKNSLTSADAGSARSSCCTAAPCGRGGSWPSRGGTSSIGSGPTGVPRRGEPLGVAAAAAAAAVRRDVLAAGGIPWFPAERRKPGVRARAAGGHKDAARGAAERVRAASRVGEAAAAIQACARGADWPRASALRGKALVSCSSKETPVRR